MMAMKDLYWLAGILEGEGSFIITPKYPKQPPQPRITLAMIDKDIVHRAGIIMMARFSKRHFSGGFPNKKDQFQAVITSSKAAGWMMTLYPLMGSRRKEQIKKCLAIWKLHKPSKRGIARALNQRPLKRDLIQST